MGSAARVRAAGADHPLNTIPKYGFTYKIFILNQPSHLSFTGNLLLIDGAQFLDAAEQNLAMFKVAFALLEGGEHLAVQFARIHCAGRRCLDLTAIGDGNVFVAKLSLRATFGVQTHFIRRGAAGRCRC